MRNQKGKNNPNWKHGKTLKKYFCIDCKKKITDRHKRCKSCSKKGIRRPKHSKRMKDKNHPNYKDGRTNKKYYCQCGKEINWQTATRGKKRCPSCAGKHLWTSKKFRETVIKKISGKNNINYIHGKGYEPYSSEFTQSLKNKIRNRDNYKCQECKMIEEEHIIVYGRVLDVHHIDYNKENCKENNLITLCKQCNMRANFNRDYWYAYFTYIIEDSLAIGGLIK